MCVCVCVCVYTYIYIVQEGTCKINIDEQGGREVKY